VSETFEVGDLVRWSRVGTVTDVEGHIAIAKDDGNEVFAFFTDAARERELELLHRPQPKPAVGSYISGRQIHDTHWQRGTTFVNDRDEVLVFSLFNLVDVVYSPTGNLRTHDIEEFVGYGAEDAKFKLVYLGEAPAGVYLSADRGEIKFAS
jgi:hypothetical protein